jgi:uncharacterized membrane protein YphA (DoxX/SURF4 family)
MLATLETLSLRARGARWLHLCVVNLRFLVGFAFVPAGLKKVLDQPFTAPDNTGPFHDFLHAFQATGFFYQFVGIVQLVTATLLITQRLAPAGAVVALPILTTIMVFCWSTAVYPTAVVVTLMFVATLALVAWDLPGWRGDRPRPAQVDEALWRLCGVGILALYLGLCAVTGEVYRPRGGARGEPGSYVLLAIALLPIVTLVVDQARHRRRARQ